MALIWDETVDFDFESTEKKIFEYYAGKKKNMIEMRKNKDGIWEQKPESVNSYVSSFDCRMYIVGIDWAAPSTKGVQYEDVDVRITDRALVVRKRVSEKRVRTKP